MNVDIDSILIGAAALMPVAYYVVQKTRNKVDDAVVRVIDGLLGFMRGRRGGR